MADFPRTLAYLDGSALGVFGVGHLGGVLVQGLLRAGFPMDRLLLCHGGSAATVARLAEAGLTSRIREPGDLARHSRIVLYMVRPQSFSAIGQCELMQDALLISFLAAIPLERIPVRPAGTSRVRVMPSGPDTIATFTAIGGLYPSDNPVAAELLSGLRIERFPLLKEEDMHAFTALGVCLPIVLACWRAQGNEVDEGELARCAARHGLPDFETILAWALRAEPRFASPAGREEYLAKAATPGGVTEAMIDRIRAGAGLAEALDAGVARSRDLSSSLK